MLIDAVFNLLLVTILGLLIAFSPMIVIVNLLVVLKSKRPILKTAVLMAGIALPLVLVAVLTIKFLDPSAQISLRGLSERINIPPLLNLLLGLWLLGLALRRWRFAKIHRRPKRTADLVMKNPPDKLPALFAFAFVKSTLSATNLFAILVVSKLIVTDSIRPPMAILAIIWVILIGLLPFVAILYFYFFKHERLEVLSDQVDSLLNRNLDFAINLVLFCLAGFFLLSGSYHLITKV